MFTHSNKIHIHTLNKIPVHNTHTQYTFTHSYKIHTHTQSTVTHSHKIHTHTFTHFPKVQVIREQYKMIKILYNLPQVYV